MKIHLFFLLSFLLFSCENEEKKIAKVKVQKAADLLTIPVVSDIARADTTLTNFCIQEIKSYNSEGELVLITETNLCESNSHKIYVESKYYVDNQLIYELRRIGWGEQKCFETKYDATGKVLSKQGYLFDKKGLLIRRLK